MSFFKKIKTNTTTDWVIAPSTTYLRLVYNVKENVCCKCLLDTLLSLHYLTM